MNIQHFYRRSEGVKGDALHYMDCGLDNVYLKNGFQLEREDGEEYFTVTDIDGLHRAIGRHIVLSRKAPSPKELRFLRNELDMSQAELAQVLGVSDQSVARWEKGTSDAPGPAVLAIRMIYLLSLLPDEERTEVMADLTERLHKMVEMDETSDLTTFCYYRKRWTGKAAA